MAPIHFTAVCRVWVTEVILCWEAARYRSTYRGYLWLNGDIPSHLKCHIQLLIRPDQGGRTSAVKATAGTRNAHYQGRLFPDRLRHRPTVKQMLLQLRLSTYVHHEHLLTRRKILLRAVPVKRSRYLLCLRIMIILNLMIKYIHKISLNILLQLVVSGASIFNTWR